MAQETAKVEAADDGFIRLSVFRDYEDGITYRSELFFQPEDVAAIADALEAFEGSPSQRSVTLTDGTLNVFAQYRSEMCNLELKREEGLPHGGYDTLDLSPGSLSGVVAALRAHAPG